MVRDLTSHTSAIRSIAKIAVALTPERVTITPF